MGILKGLSKVVLSPLKGVTEILDDVTGENSAEAQALGILSLGITSALKGTAKGIKDGVEEIFE